MSVIVVDIDSVIRFSFHLPTSVYPSNYFFFQNVHFIEVPNDQLANLGLLATVSSDGLHNFSIATEPGPSGFQLVHEDNVNLESSLNMPGLEPTIQYLTGCS